MPQPAPIPTPAPAERLLALAAEDAPPERLAALLDAEPRLARAVLQAAGALGPAGAPPASLADARLALGAEGLRDVVLAVALAALARARSSGAPRRDAALAAAFARAIAPLVGADPAAAVGACVLPADGAPRAVVLARDFARELAAWAESAGAAPPRGSAAASALGLTPIDVERLLLLRARALQLARCAAA